jgi:RNA polymerase sigma-70 factor, ECF subfamily
MGEVAKLNEASEWADARDGSRLLARIARQEPEALTELYRMWGDRLYSMALHWVKDEGAAREALQDCFLRIWKKAGDFDEQKSRGFTWAAMILRGLCLDLLRKRCRRAAFWQDSEMGSGLEVPARGGVEDLFFRETVTQVRLALSRLNATEADSIHAALFDPRSVQEHATRWGVPIGTAKIRIHRAMEKFRDLIRKGAEHEPS